MVVEEDENLWHNAFKCHVMGGDGRFNGVCLTVQRSRALLVAIWVVCVSEDMFFHVFKSTRRNDVGDDMLSLKQSHNCKGNFSTPP